MILLLNIFKYLIEKENIMKVLEMKNQGQTMVSIQLKRIQMVNI